MTGDGGAIGRLTPPWPLEGQSDGPPFVNYDAEQGLLGALLTNNRALDRLPPDFRPEHFGDPLHARIFQKIRDLVDGGHGADPRVLHRDFMHEEASPGMPVTAYLLRLMQTVGGMVNAEEYAATIIDFWARRATVDACREIIAGAADPETAGAAVLEGAEARIRAVADGQRVGRRDLNPVAEGLDDTLRRIESAWRRGGVAGLSTGLSDLDKALAGLHPEDLIIVAGRPGMGKSDLAINIAHAAATNTARVAFFSLEMSRAQMQHRMLALATKIPAASQIAGLVEEENLATLSAAAGRLRSLPLHIDDTPAASVDTIASRARRMKRRHGLDLIVVDYLQLIAPGNTRRNREMNRTVEVTMITQGLKAIAKDIGAPLIALSQLSRAVEGREDKRPQLSDLRESGSIEQDADVVLFPYRESYYLDRDPPKIRARESEADFADRRREHEMKAVAAMNVCDIIIGKQRMGAPGSVQVYYRPAHSHFADMNWRDGE